MASYPHLDNARSGARSVGGWLFGMAPVDTDPDGRWVILGAIREDVRPVLVAPGPACVDELCMGDDVRATMLDENLGWRSGWGEMGFALLIAAGDRVSVVHAALFTD